MKRLERVFLHLINLWLLVFVCSAVGFLFTYYLSESMTAWPPILGGVVALAIWWLLRRKLMEWLLGSIVYQLTTDVLYMVGLFGMFMGVPVFNVLPGVLLAYIVGLNARESGMEEAPFEQRLKRVNRLTLGVLFFFLAASGTIALIDPYTGANLQGMLGLAREVTTLEIVAVILVGGAGLLAAQWWMMRFIGRWVYRLKVE
ncbi:MAG: hypothetical protein JW750_06425 [Anaerolineaceae bacterium]|nr:hypothetical protein [Anaerolineaceae bacterium]